MATKRQRRIAALKAVGYFIVDAFSVLLFVIAGRDTRAPDLVGTLAEAWPFLVGLSLGWLIGRAWRRPRGVRFAGIIAVATASIVGLTIRELIGQPTDTRFVVITFVSLAAFLLGWRGIAWILDALFGRALPAVVDEKYRR